MVSLELLKMNDEKTLKILKARMKSKEWQDEFKELAKAIEKDLKEKKEKQIKKENKNLTLL